MVLRQRSRLYGLVGVVVQQLAMVSALIRVARWRKMVPATGPPQLVAKILIDKHFVVRLLHLESHG